VLDEGFLDMPCSAAHPQSLVMEAAWVSAWFQRVLAESERNPDRVLIADRSPMSAAFYTRDGKGKLLEPLIRATYDDLAQAGVEVYTVYLQVHRDVLWERIQRRLEFEPDRAQYKEDSREWMDTVVSFYESHGAWDFTVDNSVDGDLPSAVGDVMAEVINRVGKRSPRFRERAAAAAAWSAASSSVSTDALSTPSTSPPSPSVVAPFPRLVLDSSPAYPRAPPSPQRIGGAKSKPAGERGRAAARGGDDDLDAGFRAPRDRGGVSTGVVVVVGGKGL